MEHSKENIARAFKEKKKAVNDWHKAKNARDASGERGEETYDSNEHLDAEEYADACEAVANDTEHTYKKMTKTLLYKNKTGERQ